MSDRLSSGQRLKLTFRGGQWLSAPALVSKNGRAYVVFQGDSNLVVYNGKPHAGGDLWASNSVNSGGTDLVMQGDGNLVMLDSRTGRVTWAAGSQGHPGAYAVIQDDGNFVIYAPSGAAVWATNTSGFQHAHSGGGFLGSIGSALGSVGHAVQSAAGKLTDNPIWNVVQTGASFIPGLGTAVSAGMASAAAFGRGESLSDLALAAGKAALPAGLGHGIDIAIGAVKGHGLAPEQLHELREQLPTPGLRGAFDAGVAIATKASPDAIARMAARQSADVRAVMMKALAAHRAGGAPALAPVASVRAMPGRSRVLNVPRTLTPPHITRPFPNLSSPANRIASAMINTPTLRSMPAAKLAQSNNVDARDAQSAIAAFLERFNAEKELDWRDVGEWESFDQSAKRHGVNAPDLGAWPTDTGAMHVMAVPPVGITRAQLHRIYAEGDANIKKAILAHELLTHVARNTGELDGTSWVIQANGDWPAAVAKTVVGDSNRWKEILAVNPNLHLQSNGNIPQWTKGTRVQLPPSWFPTAIVPVAAVQASPVPSPSSSAPSSSGGPPFVSQYPLGYPSGLYVVRDGDTGEKIAANITGDKNRWRELLVTNPTKADPKYGIALYTGNQITLPRTWVKPQASPPVAAVGQAPPIVAPPAAGGGSKQTPLPAAPPAPPLDWSAPSGSTTPSPVAPAVPVAAAPPLVAGPPIVTGSAEQIGALQIMLAAFFRNHPEATWTTSGAPFGSTPEDLAGVWNDRTTAAVAGFERWWNGKRQIPTLPTDGLPDTAVVQALMTQTAADGGSAIDTSIGLTVKGTPQSAAAPPGAAAPPKKSSGADFLVPLGLLLLGAA